MQNTNMHLFPRQRVLKWMKQRNQWELQSILIIQNTQSIKKLSEILTLEGSPKQITHYAIAQLTAQKQFITRHKYHYRVDKKRKFDAGSLLEQSLVVTLHDNKALTVRHHSMTDVFHAINILSEEKAFNYTNEKRESIWFNPSDYHSFAEWVAHFLEKQILDAFEERKRVRAFNQCYFWHSNYLKLEDFLLKTVKQQLFNELKKKGGDNPQVQFINKDVQFQFTSFKNRIQAVDRQPYEAFIEYSWLNPPVNSDCSYLKVMQKVNEKIYDIYQQAAFDHEMKQIQALQKGTQKKKRRPKKKKPVKQELEKASQQIPQEKQVEEILQTETKTSHTDDFGSIAELNNDVCAKKEQQAIIPTQHEQENRHCIDKTTVQSQLSQDAQKGGDQYQCNFEFDNEKQSTLQEAPLRPSKDLQIEEKISQLITFFTENLKESSNVYSVHRDAIIKVVRESIEEMRLKMNWQLVVYGSCATGFTLKQSDIDLILLVSDSDLSLQELFMTFKIKSWVFDCEYVKASVPIITFNVDLRQYPGNVLGQRQLKKSPLFRVDLSLGGKRQKHVGIENTKYIKTLLSEHEGISSTCYLLKELLRQRGLNKPFLGGVSSFVLVNMVFGILLTKKALDVCCYQQIVLIADFMANEFKATKTVIRVTQGDQKKLVADPFRDLNIEDPLNIGLIKTSAFEIKLVIYHLHRLKKTLLDIAEEVSLIEMEEKKKLKKIVLDAIEQFIYNKDQLAEKDM